MPSEGLRRSQKRWRESQKRRQEQNWTKMSYYDKVRVGDLVGCTIGGTPQCGLVIATADTVEHPPEWGDTYVLWNGRDLVPVWEDCGALEVISEGS